MILCGHLPGVLLFFSRFSFLLPTPNYTTRNSFPLPLSPYFGLRNRICRSSGGEPRRMGGPPVPTPRVTYR